MTADDRPHVEWDATLTGQESADPTVNGSTGTAADPDLAGFTQNPEHAATWLRVDSLRRVGVALDDAQRVLPARDAAVLARALQQVNQDRADRGEPALSDLSALIDWALVEEQQRARLTPGGSFALDLPPTPPALWGDGDTVLWAAGETLMVGGPIGVGKSTLTLRLVLARIGVIPPDLLGYPVRVDPRRVLYLAGDRPRQMARNLHRMVSHLDRATLDDRLLVWEGALPFDIADHPERLAQWCTELEVSAVMLDSLKDFTVDLADGERGNRVAQALQRVTDAGVEVVVNHHTTKHGKDGKEPRNLADLYGSTWLTAKAGSVVLLWGKPGDPVLNFRHLKPPMDEAPPMDVELGQNGTVVVHQGGDLLGLLQAAGKLDAQGAARLLYGTGDPTPAERERARRSLDKLVGKGLAHREPGTRGGKHPTPDLFYPTTPREAPDG